MNFPRHKNTAVSAALLLGAFSLGILLLGSFRNITHADFPVPPPGSAPVEYGIDRSNMSTEWTISWPSEPNVSPFLASEYNDPGDFEARRVAVFDGLARLHPQWFRDGFGKGQESLFVDTVRQVHARGIKMLTVFSPVASDFNPSDYLSPAVSGCQWGTYPLSKINLDAYRQRIESQFQAVVDAHLTVDAFEVGNEMDLYCNDADNPTGADWAKHNWKWFLTPEQVQTFVNGYAPYLATSVAAIRKYFPNAKIITFGVSMPPAAPLIQALASVPDDRGNLTDYTDLVDGYGSHIYPTSDTTLDLVTGATASLTGEAAVFPHIAQKPIWITEWNESESSGWNGHPWYFQYTAEGQPGGDFNKADPQGVYPAMLRADAIRTFQRDVIAKLRSQATGAVNIGYVLYYAYDATGTSPKCDNTGFNKSIGVTGICFSGVVAPLTGDLLPGVAAAVMNAPPPCPHGPLPGDAVDATDAEACPYEPD